jgi:hypothetical protein
VPRERRSKYFWPASAITPDEMALLYAARETSRPRVVSISELIARAIRKTYGHVQTAQSEPQPEPQPEERKAA